METAVQNQTAPPTTVFVASTMKGWTVYSENGIKISGYYKSFQHAKDAVRNLVADSNVEIVLNVPDGSFFG